MQCLVLVCRLPFLSGMTGLPLDYIYQVKILASIQHRHILAFLGLCHYYDLKSEMSSIVLVTEWCPATLRAWICESSTSRERLRLDALQIVEEVALGMRYLHDDCGIIHRDLKPENVLLSSDVCLALLIVVVFLGHCTVLSVKRCLRSNCVAWFVFNRVWSKFAILACQFEEPLKVASVSPSWAR